MTEITDTPINYKEWVQSIVSNVNEVKVGQSSLYGMFALLTLSLDPKENCIPYCIEIAKQLHTLTPTLYGKGVDIQLYVFICKQGKKNHIVTFESRYLSLDTQTIIDSHLETSDFDNINL